MIGIINYGMGNLASVKNAFDYLKIESEIINTPGELKSVDKIVLPGVGAFGRAMENLNSLGFTNEIKEFVVVNRKPILGICLGMQLLLDSSTEHGSFSGLGIVQGRVLFFGNEIVGMPIPHMGWNNVIYNQDSKLYKDIEPSPSYYFVHSYYCKLDNPGHVSATTEYGINFHSSIENEHIYGCQFHPEKSQKNGLAIFKNFDSL